MTLTGSRNVPMRAATIALSLVVWAVGGGVGCERPDARPPTTWVVNFDDAGGQVMRFDRHGHAIDAHDGDLVHFDGAWYLYGTSYDCGYGLQVVGTPFCGFRAYRSLDLATWEDLGPLFDASTPAWQQRCAPPRFGCYRPHVARRTDGRYVLWINGYWNASGYAVFTAPSPAGPWTEQPEPTLARHGADSDGYANGDHDLFVSRDGTGYLVYTRINAAPSHQLVIERLDPTFTTGTGQAVVVGAGREAPSMFEHGRRYHLVYSATCSYCGAGRAYTRSALSPLGPWGPETEISADSCGGQVSFVASVGDQRLLGVDLWRHGQPNQGDANYHWTLLEITTAVQPFTCNPVQPLALGTTAPVQAPAQIGQSSGDYGFRSYCDIAAGWSRSQSFVAERGGVLTNVSVGTYRPGEVTDDLHVDVVRLDPSMRPVGPVLATRTIPRDTVGASLRLHDLDVQVPVHGGNRYGLVLRSDTTSGCFGFGYSDLQPYALGHAAHRAGTGAWTVEPTRTLRFATTIS